MNTLVQYLIDEGYLKTPEIRRACALADRALFFKGERFTEGMVYQDAALVLDSGEMAFHPSTAVQMLELLAPKSGEKFLEIGTGWGWQTAMLAFIASGFRPFGGIAETGRDAKSDSHTESLPLGRVISTDNHKRNVEQARENLEQFKLISGGAVELVRRDAVFGYTKEAPYDKIISNICPNLIPPKWKENLKVGGRLVMPFRQSILVLDKTGKNSFEQSSYFGFTFSKTIFS